MKRILLSVIVVACCLIAFTACYVGTPLVTSNAENNRTYEVDYLFEHEGCKVYRFYDNGNYVYFTNRAGEVTTIKNDSTDRRTLNIIR